MTTLINLVGGPGAGKSTTAAATFAELKLRGYNAEYVPEYAKDLVWQGTEALLGYPIHLFGEQHHRIARLWGKVDVIVTDSPLLLCLFYAREYDASYYTQEFSDLVERERGRFTPAIDVLIKRVKPYNPAGRVQTEAEANAIDKKLELFIGGIERFDAVVPGDRYAAGEIVKLYEHALAIEAARETLRSRTYGPQRH